MKILFLLIQKTLLSNTRPSRYIKFETILIVLKFKSLLQRNRLYKTLISHIFRILIFYILYQVDFLFGFMMPSYQIVFPCGIFFISESAFLLNYNMLILYMCHSTRRSTTSLIVV